MTSCLVTGSGQRLGAAIAAQLAHSCSDVLVHTLETSPDSTMAAVRAGGARAWHAAGDLADSQFVAALAERLLELPGPHVLVNSVSLYARDSSLDDAARARMQAVNVDAPRMLTNALLEHGGGVVVDLLDAGSGIRGSDFETYDATRRALREDVHALAVAGAPDFRINAVLVGPILPAPGGAEEPFLAVASGVPLRRRGQPIDIARAVEFLVGSDYITGAILPVDGGQHLMGESIAGI